MRPSEPLSRLAKRLLLAPVFAFGLASIIATGGGTSDGSTDSDDEDESSAAISVSAAVLTVVRGGVVDLRVDIEGLPEGRGASGYTIDLSETASRIDITTRACPPGVGTVSCRDWSISPGLDSVPGEYDMEIGAVGTPEEIERSDVVIIVLGDLPPLTPAVVATQRLVVTSDGRLWATDSNLAGQAGVGFWNGCTEVSNRCLQPRSLYDYVQVGTSVDWVDAAASVDVSVAVRADGSVWAWGDNTYRALGFVGDGETQIVPHQVPGLPAIARVSIGQRDEFEESLMGLTPFGLVYTWNKDSARVVPLDNVVAIAGGTENNGVGFALALRSDGTVWQWGDRYDGGALLPEAGTPVVVSGLPTVKAIAAGVRRVRDEDIAFALVATANGDVLTWDEGASPQPVPNLSGIDAVTADLNGGAAALASDGTVWSWRPGDSDPERVDGLPRIARLGKGAATLAIAGDCTSTSGSLWRESTFPVRVSRIPRFGMGCQPVPEVQLTIDRTGEGTVIANPPYVNCGSECSNRVPAGSLIKLYYTAAPGWRLAPTANPCPVGSLLSMDADKTCSAAFERAPMPKTLSVSIRGGGRVLGDPAGIDCPGICTKTYSPEAGPMTTVRLTATAELGYRSAAFRGDPDCADGSVLMDVSRQCDVVFDAFPVPAAPTGLSAVPGNDAVELTWNGITDGSVVSYTIERVEGAAGAIVIAEGIRGGLDSFRDLDVVPGRQYTYRLMAINPSGSSAPASVTTTVQTPISLTLTVQVTGPGRVSSSPAGIDCGSDCTQSYGLVTNVTLVATANTSARFDGWGGSCAGTAPSVMVTMDDNKTCTATFTAVSEGGWETLVSQLASSQERDLRSSLVLNDAGSAYVAYTQTVGTQNRLTVRQEGAGFPILSTLNANATWSATGFELALDPAGAPLLIYNMDLQDVMVARWSGSQWDGLPPSTPPVPQQRMNLTAAGGSRVQIARRGNTLVAAWIEAQQIAMRRYDFVTNQWDSGAFVPGPTNPFDIDLALDSNGLAVIAWSDGLLGSRLHAIRETGPGAWTQLGGDIGVRPATSEMVMEFGIHVDTSNAIRLVWLEGDNGYYVSVAQFDGAAWGPLPGHTNMAYFFHPYPVRSLSVNRNPALFAFAFEWDQNDIVIDGLIATRQLVGGGLTIVGRLESTIHPRVGHLSLAMNEADRATIAQSEHTPADTLAPFKLVIRRHVP